MLTYASAFLRRIQNRLSLGEWIVRALNLSLSTPKDHEPGLVLLQIDSLSCGDLLHAVERGWMPFFKKLLERERYQLKHLYSGVPSSTPSVQGELFYGIRQAVPAFEYRDCCGKVFMLSNPHAAGEIEKRLVAKFEGVLLGGSSYGNIFSGGAKESHFCLAALDHQSYWRTLLPYAWLIVLVFNPLSLLRALYTFLSDLVLTLWEFIRKMRSAREVFHELIAIPVRIFAAIFLKEFITLGCRIDIARSLPIICANFFSYDELAHRFGKRSRFTEAALRRIDKSIHQIFQAANRATGRDYNVWIYSDHGQEHTVSYYQLYGASVRDKIFEAFARAMPQISKKDVTITAQGPLGFIYFNKEISSAEIEQAALSLVQYADIPLVLGAPNGEVIAWTSEGRFRLPGDASAVFGKEHPYLEEVAKEMAELCQRKDTGALMISGWRLASMPVSFPSERASHGGPGKDETDGFVLLPFNSLLELTAEKKYLRAGDLHQGIKHYMQGQKREELSSRLIKRTAHDPFRVMSYNVHSCIGMDRKLSPERIARVIARHAPDVVALQELDHGRSRSQGKHQAQAIAELLDMTYHFFPALRIEEEEYGDAILSRHPLKLVRAEELAGFKNISGLEPRGALWVEIDFFGKKVQLITTHLSLLARERRVQVDNLLDHRWLGNEKCSGPVIFCGDLNTLPSSEVSRKLRTKMRDVFYTGAAKETLTFPGFRPTARIDYIYVSEGIKTSSLDVPRMSLERVASDHVPIIADLILP